MTQEEAEETAKNVVSVKVSAVKSG
jgi:hypothetical protein